MTKKIGKATAAVSISRSGVSNFRPKGITEAASISAAPSFPKDWRDLIHVSNREFLNAVRGKLLSRRDEIKLAARRAYEIAPIGGEALAVWNAIKDYRNLQNIEVLLAAWELPSRKVESEVMDIYHPIFKKNRATAERRELARRRQVLASMKAKR